VIPKPGLSTLCRYKPSYIREWLDLARNCVHA